MRVLIATPTFESIMPDTYKSIWDLDKSGNECDWDFVRGYDVATARNRIAQRSIDGGYDAVLMIDNDVVVPKDALLNLSSDNVDFVSGFYLHRNDDNKPDGHTCVCRLRDENGFEYYNYPLESEYFAKELEESRKQGINLLKIHGGGMGCAFIKTSVFEKLAYPWFDWVNYADDHRGMLSEDLFFCEKLKEAGIPRYVDARVGCGHMFRRIENAM